MKSCLVIPGELIDLNTYINAERTNRFKAAKIKKEQTDFVATLCKLKRMKKVSEPCEEILFYWYTKDKKKDSDNIVAAKKWIMDGLVKAGILPNDSRRFVNHFKDFVYVDKTNPRVEVELW